MNPAYVTAASLGLILGATPVVEYLFESKAIFRGFSLTAMTLYSAPSAAVR